jgi:hypothetical protein
VGGVERTIMIENEVSAEALAGIRRALPRKYHNKKVEVDGEVFDSQAEARRWQELRLLQQAGEIRDLKRQPKFELQPGFTDAQGQHHHAIRYVGDFAYTGKDNRLVIEDVKGRRTETYLLKRKLLLYKLREKWRGVRFVEIDA